MRKKYTEIINYFIECVNEESREAFKISKNDKNLFFFKREGEQVEDFFFSNETFLEQESSDPLKNYISRKNAYHKNDKIYLALEYILDHTSRRKFLVPLYVVEVLIEEREDKFRISKLDYEPTLNLSLLMYRFSINEILMLADEISEEESWDKKISLFYKNLDKNIVDKITSTPFLFLGNLFQGAQSSVIQELEWIKTKYLNEFDNTALSFFFKDKVKPDSHNGDEFNYIEIFDLDNIQNETVQYALENPFTVITGPPGTGKSQVVLNLLANLYFNNNSVLFASKNNKAVNTVLDKLETIQNNYCCFVRLGNKHEKRKGLNKILERLNYEHTSIKNPVSYSSIERLLNEIEPLNKEHAKLDECFKNYCISIAIFGDEQKSFPEFIDKCLDDESFNQNIDEFLEGCAILRKELDANLKQFNIDKELCENKLRSHDLISSKINSFTIELPEEIKDFLGDNKIRDITPDCIDNFHRIEKEANKRLKKYIEDKNLREEALKYIKDKKNEIETKKKIIENFQNDNFDKKLTRILQNNTTKLQNDFTVDLLGLKKLKIENKNLREEALKYIKDKKNEIETKKKIIENFQNDNFDKKLTRILQNNTTKLQNDFTVDLLGLKKLKTDLQSFKENEINLFQKIFNFFYPSYFRNRYFKELKIYFEALPDSIQQYFSNNLPDISIINLIGAVSTIESISEFIELNSELNDIQLSLQEKKEYIYKIRHRFFIELKIYFEALPDSIQQYFSNNLADISITNLIRVISTIESISEFIELNSELNDIELKLQKKELHANDIKSKLDKVNNEDIIHQLDVHLANLPEKTVKFYKCNMPNCNTKAEYCIKLISDLDPFLEIAVKYKKLSRKLETISEEINQIRIRLSDDYFEDSYSTIDLYFSELPQSLNNYIEAKIKNRDLDNYNRAMITLENFLVSFLKLQDLKKNVDKNRNKLERCLDSEDIEEKLSALKKDLVKKSRKIFNDYLLNKIDTSKAEFNQLICDYFDNWKDGVLTGLFRKITKYLGIIITTNLSTRYNIPNMPAIFDYVIIDEASQNDIPSIIPLLFRAKKAVIIGDPNQLRHITSLKDRNVEEIAKKHGIEKDLINFHYNKNSAYHIAQRKFTDLTKKIPFILRNHYRCHKDIIQFSNINFYKSELFPKSFIKKDVSPIKLGIFWNDVNGSYSDKSNPNEARVIIEFLKNIKYQGLNNEIEIGIITPFRNQKILITNLLFRNKMIKGRDTDRILASTVHSFQGDEKDIIIYSPVMSSGIANRTLSWLDRSTDLLNVAITRAKSSLIIFGDTKFCSKTKGLHKKLLNYCIEIQKRQVSPTFESDTEEFFYKQLTKSGIFFEYQVPIGRYRVDFLLKMNDKYLCIEIDGSQHQQNKSYDYSRDKFLKGIGYEVIRVPNNYVEKNSQEIIASLKQICVC